MPQWLFEWMKVPSHVQLEGNVRADTLAELHGGGGGRLRGFWDANYPCPPPPPPRGLRPTVSCQRCRPEASMGAEGARCYMNTKGALRKILSN